MANKIKGGYKNVSLKGVDLIGASPEVDGLYDALINSYDKPIQLCNIVIDGVKKKNAFVQVKKDGSYVIVENLYGYKLTIGSDNAIGVSDAIPVVKPVYIHPISINDFSNPTNPLRISMLIFTNDATPFTLATLKQWIDNLYAKVGNTIRIVCSGAVVNSSKTIIASWFYRTATQYGITGVNTDGGMDAIYVKDSFEGLFSPSVVIDDGVNQIN